MLPSPASSYPCKPYCLSILLRIFYIIRDACPCFSSTPSPRLPLSDCSVVSSNPSVPRRVDHVRPPSWFRQLNHHPLTRSPLDLESSNSLLTWILDGRTPTQPRILLLSCLVALDLLTSSLVPGSFMNLVQALLGFVGRPPYAYPLRRNLIFTPSSHWISFPLSNCFLYVFSVVDSSSCLIADLYYYRLLLSPVSHSPLEYILCPLPSIGDDCLFFSLFLL